MKKFFEGGLIGFMNGFFGSGGGVIAVPVLEKNGCEPNKAHATSVALIFVLSLVTAFSYGFSGNLDFSAAWKYIPYEAAGAIAGAVAQPTFCSSKASFFTRASEEVANSLVASDYKDPPTVNQNYIVRRLTPTECARLQGFPDWWCDDLETENPTEDEISRWQKIFDEYNKAIGKNCKPKTNKQILKWLKNPRSDSAEYKMWGNGVALPCVVFVLAGIAYFNSSE